MALTSMVSGHAGFGRSEPLSFGATYNVRVWSGMEQAARTLLLAVNGDGVHLYVASPRAKRFTAPPACGWLSSSPSSLVFVPALADL